MRPWQRSFEFGRYHGQRFGRDLGSWRPEAHVLAGLAAGAPLPALREITPISVTAGNDGGASAQFPATTSDRLFITVTDPFGNSTSYESSTFINQATSETSVGATGGVIEGPGGTAIDIPEGAVSRGISMKLDVLSPEQYDTLFPNQRPDFGGRPIGSVLKISSTNPQTLEKPAKLTFAVPDNFATNFPSANARDAVFYVLKRAVLPDGTVAFETVDHAFAVCPGETPGAKSAAEGGSAAPTCTAPELKVKTASPPFPEFTGDTLADIYLILTYDWWGAGEQSRQALAGVIAGRIRRQVWGTDANAGQVKYEPVAGALVSVSESTVPLNGASEPEVRKPNTVVTRSQADGTYSVWDTHYQGGTVKVVAEAGGLKREGFGFEGNPQDMSAAWGPFPALRFYRNKAHVDVVFEAQQPPPPAPDVEIRVLRLSDGVDTGGIAGAGQCPVRGVHGRFRARFRA